MSKPTLIFCLLIVYVAAHGCGRRHGDRDHHDPHNTHEHRYGSGEHDDDRQRQGVSDDKQRGYDSNQIGRDDAGRNRADYSRGRADDQRNRKDDSREGRDNDLDERFGGNQGRSHDRNQPSKNDDSYNRYQGGRGGYDRGHNTRY